MEGKNTFRITLILLVSVSILILFQIQCRHDGLNVADLDKVCYETEIAGIFSSCNASGCHDQQSRKGGYTFTDYSSVMKAVTPFNAQKSKVYKAITGKGFVQLMPPTGALNEAERILIRVWIDQGAVNTTCN